MNLKINKYKCDTCKKETVVGQRDNGQTPHVLSCNQNACAGKMVTHWGLVSQELTPDVIMIRPKDKKEWDVIYGGILETVKKENPKKKDLRTKKIADKQLLIAQRLAAQGVLMPIAKNQFKAIGYATE